MLPPDVRNALAVEDKVHWQHVGLHRLLDGGRIMAIFGRDSGSLVPCTNHPVTKSPVLLRRFLIFLSCFSSLLLPLPLGVLSTLRVVPSLFSSGYFSVLLYQCLFSACSLLKPNLVSFYYLAFFTTEFSVVSFSISPLNVILTASCS